MASTAFNLNEQLDKKKLVSYVKKFDITPKGYY